MDLIINIFIVIVYIIIGFSVLMALLTGINAIYESWTYSIFIGKSSKFLSHVFSQIEGNYFTAFVIIILCIPIWIILSIIILIRKKDPNYKRFTKMMADERYITAIELMEKENEKVKDWNKVKIVGMDYLVQHGIHKKEAEENLDLFAMMTIHL